MARVHCRIGSLEIHRRPPTPCRKVHCRIGSLENHPKSRLGLVHVHCRIGSLENLARPLRLRLVRSLPHRQLRKYGAARRAGRSCSLPHRQLRNATEATSPRIPGSLPHRQLRKQLVFQLLNETVHCRIGSLEILDAQTAQIRQVHCRIGSLETMAWTRMLFRGVHCRIGSLETLASLVEQIRACSLPHRQLRK